ARTAARLPDPRRLDRAVLASLRLHRRVLAAGRLDADADARSCGPCGAAGVAAAARLPSALLVVVLFRVSGVRRRARDLLADDRAAAVLVLRLSTRQRGDVPVADESSRPVRFVGTRFAPSRARPSRRRSCSCARIGPSILQTKTSMPRTRPPSATTGAK